jgi:sulfur-oxidizing protein SoxZ
MATDTIRLQAKLKENETLIKVLITHPMDVERKAEDGSQVSAHFIKEIRCLHNGKEVLLATWTAAISKNPYLSFKFKGGKVGDTVTFSWLDNKDDKDSAETTIKEAV